MKSTRAEPGSEASGSEVGSGSESLEITTEAPMSATSSEVESGSESLEITTEAPMTAIENKPSCRFFPGLDPGPNGNCIESCGLLRSAFELKQEQMKRLAAVRSMDEMYDYMLAQGKTAAATKQATAKSKSGGEAAKNAGGEATKKF